MKFLGLVFSLILLSSTSIAEVVEIEVPAGHKVVSISHTIETSGCSGSVNFANVIKTNDMYVIGSNIGLQNDDEVWINVMPGPRPGPEDLLPERICLAVVEYVTKARFIVHSNEDTKIKVDMPSYIAVDHEVELEDVRYAH